MSKLLSSMLLAIALISNLAYAEAIKSTKKTKSADINKTASDEEFMKRFMVLDQEEKDAKAKTKAIEDEGKKLDEINKLLGVDSKKK